MDHGGFQAGEADGPIGAGPLPGQFLYDFDPDFFDGFGKATWIKDAKQALRFETIAEALNCWKTVSTVRPTRCDGKPNRPMTAYHITFATVT